MVQDVNTSASPEPEKETGAAAEAASAPETPETVTSEPPKMEAAEATEMTPEQREELASKLVDRFAVWAGAAGLVPLPIVDTIAVGGLQIAMLRRISNIYGVAFSENRGKAVIASLVGAIVPMTSSVGVVSLFKAVPFVGPITAAFVMPALSAGATYAVGKTFIQHFASGGTLLDFNAPDYREFIKAQKETWESRSARPSQPAPSAPSAAETQQGSAGSA